MHGIVRTAERTASCAPLNGLLPRVCAALGQIVRMWDLAAERCACQLGAGLTEGHTVRALAAEHNVPLHLVLRVWVNKVNKCLEDRYKL